jgi:AAA+ ATPase superfamily predicted ATPase
MQNPFIVSGYLSAKYFCDREKETAELIRKVTNGNNLVLTSPRRMGKTGLIEHCFTKPGIAKKYYTFYVDIYATSNLKEFVFKLGKEIFETLKPKGKKFIEHFFSIITSLRPAFKIDELTGSPVFDIGIGEIRAAQFTLEEIFKYLEAADKQCIVAIDEFQQIEKYPEKNIEAVLRTYIQCSKNAVFVFAGSRRHIMQNIFFSSSRPFYQSAALLNLEALDKAKYTAFVINHFSEANQKISPELVEKIYDRFEGHTWYMQAVFNEIFSFLDEGKSCTIKDLQTALDNKIASYETLFLTTLSLISERQKELLYAIAKDGKATNITSSNFVKRHSLHSSASVQTSAKQLLEKEIVTAENNVYQVYDRFFGLWLKGVFGTGYRL